MKTSSYVIVALFASVSAQADTVPVAKDSALETYDPTSTDKNEAKAEAPPAKVPAFNEPSFSGSMPASQGLAQFRDVYQEPAEHTTYAPKSPAYFNQPTFSGSMKSSQGLVQQRFATGMNGDEDLGEDITMKGDKFHFAQNLAQAEPVVYSTKGYGANGGVEKLSFFDPKIAKAHTSFYAQTYEGPEATTTTTSSSVGEPEKVSILDPKIAKAHTTFYHGQQRTQQDDNEPPKNPNNEPYLDHVKDANMAPIGSKFRKFDGQWVNPDDVNVYPSLSQLRADPEAPQTTTAGGKRLESWAKYDTKGYGPVEKLSFFDPKVAKAHTSFYSQLRADPEAPQTTTAGGQRLDSWAKYDTKGYGPVEKTSFFDPKVAKAHTSFYAQAEPASDRNPNWAPYSMKGYGPEEKQSFFDPKVAKAHTSFYAQETPKTVEPEICANEAAGQPGASQVPLSIDATNPEKVHTLDPKICKSRTTFYHLNQEAPKTLNQYDDPVYSSTPAPFCSSSGWCGNQWFPTPEEKPAPPRIGHYDAEGSWIVPENLRGNRGAALMQVRGANQSPDPVYSSTPAPYCSSSGWCGHQWFPTPEEKPAPPRIGEYDAEGAWIIPENLRGNTRQAAEAAALMQMNGIPLNEGTYTGVKNFPYPGPEQVNTHDLKIAGYHTTYFNKK